MSSKLEVYVSDSKESLDFHINEIYSEKSKNSNIKVICPGAAPVATPIIKQIANKNKTFFGPAREYVQKFTEDNLKKFAGHDIIIENIHLLSQESVDRLIQFAIKYHCNIYMFSKIYNSANGKFDILNYLADMGYSINQVEDFAVPAEQENIKPAGKKSRSHSKLASNAEINNMIKIAKIVAAEKAKQEMQKSTDTIHGLQTALQERGIKKR